MDRRVISLRHLSKRHRSEAGVFFPVKKSQASALECEASPGALGSVIMGTILGGFPRNRFNRSSSNSLVFVVFPTRQAGCAAACPGIRKWWGLEKPRTLLVYQSPQRPAHVHRRSSCPRFQFARDPQRIVFVKM